MLCNIELWNHWNVFFVDVTVFCRKLIVIKKQKEDRIMPNNYKSGKGSKSDYLMVSFPETSKRYGWTRRIDQETVFSF